MQTSEGRLFDCSHMQTRYSSHTFAKDISQHTGSPFSVMLKVEPSGSLCLESETNAEMP